MCPSKGSNLLLLLHGQPFRGAQGPENRTSRQQALTHICARAREKAQARSPSEGNQPLVYRPASECRRVRAVLPNTFRAKSLSCSCIRQLERSRMSCASQHAAKHGEHHQHVGYCQCPCEDRVAAGAPDAGAEPKAYDAGPCVQSPTSNSEPAAT